MPDGASAISTIDFSSPAELAEYLLDMDVSKYDEFVLHKERAVENQLLLRAMEWRDRYTANIRNFLLVKMVFVFAKLAKCTVFCCERWKKFEATPQNCGFCCFY